MLGLMQDWPLLCHRVNRPAAINHAERPVVTARRRADPYHHLCRRSGRGRSRSRTGSRRPASGSATGRDLGLEHLAPSRGLVGDQWASARSYHTVRSAPVPEQIVWIVNHAEDRVMMVDLTFVPLLEKLADKLPTSALRDLTAPRTCRRPP